MCVELAGIALCAPKNPSELQFTCSRLHMVASSRELCSDTKGQCMCFFGTCGKIDRVNDPTPIDFASLDKVRCAICANREDATGHRRDGLAMVESKLLNRVPIPDECLPVHLEVLKSIWKGADHCNLNHSARPTSSGVSSPKTTAPSVDSAVNGVGRHRHEAASHVEAEPSRKNNPSVKSISEDKPNNDNLENKSSLSNTGVQVASGIAPHPGLAASRWAPAPANLSMPAPKRHDAVKIPSPTPSRTSSKLRATAREFESARRPSNEWPSETMPPAISEQTKRDTPNVPAARSPNNADGSATRVMSTRIIPEIASMKAFLRI